MWCPTCRADVAAELSSDNRRMLCARCQNELGLAAAAVPSISPTPRTAETERDARELLARWSANNLLDVSVPVTTSSSFKKPISTPEPLPKVAERRFDPPTYSIPAPSSAFIAAALDPQPATVLPLSKPEQPVLGTLTASAPEPEPVAVPQPTATPTKIEAKITETIEAVTPAPAPAVALPTVHSELPRIERQEHHGHHDRLVRDALKQPARNRSAMSHLAGQLCAYCGVGLLTCGSVLIMWSYFGGPPRYMPTGWLTAAIGQMLLFLGVVTLISSGLDQTVSEISWRIDQLADEVHGMSHALEQFEHEHHDNRTHRGQSSSNEAFDRQRRDAA